MKHEIAVGGFRGLVTAFRQAGLPMEKAVREASAEILAPYRTAREALEAARMLRRTGGKQITTRGYVIGPNDIKEALRTARKFKVGLAITAPLFPAGAGAIHAEAAREFHKILREIGHPFGEYLREGWRQAKAHGRGPAAALRFAWAALQGNLAKRESPPRSIGDVMRMAWERLGVPVEEKPGEEPDRRMEAIRQQAKEYCRQNSETLRDLLHYLEKTGNVLYTQEGWEINAATLAKAFGLPRVRPTIDEWHTARRFLEREEPRKALDYLIERGFSEEAARDKIARIANMLRDKPTSETELASQRVFWGKGRLGRWEIHNPKRELKDLVEAYRIAIKRRPSYADREVLQVKGKAFRVPLRAFQLLRSAPPGPVEILVDPDGFRIKWETGGWRFPRVEQLDGDKNIPEFAGLLAGHKHGEVKLPPKLKAITLYLPAVGGGQVPYPARTSKAFPHFAIVKSPWRSGSILIHLKSPRKEDEPVEVIEGMPKATGWFYSINTPPGSKLKDLAVYAAFLESHFGNLWGHELGAKVKEKVRQLYGEKALEALAQFLRRANGDYQYADLHDPYAQWQRLEEIYQQAHEKVGINPAVWNKPRKQKSKGEKLTEKTEGKQEDREQSPNWPKTKTKKRIQLPSEIRIDLKKAPWWGSPDEVRHWLSELISREAQRWFREQSRDPWARFYLYYKPATWSEPGDIRVSQVPPGPGWQLAHPQAVGRDGRGGWTMSAALQWIGKACNHLPLRPHGYLYAVRRGKMYKVIAVRPRSILVRGEDGKETWFTRPLKKGTYLIALEEEPVTVGR